MGSFFCGRAKGERILEPRIIKISGLVEIDDLAKIAIDKII